MQTCLGRKNGWSDWRPQDQDTRVSVPSVHLLAHVFPWAVVWSITLVLSGLIHSQQADGNRRPRSSAGTNRWTTVTVLLRNSHRPERKTIQHRAQDRPAHDVKSDCPSNTTRPASVVQDFRTPTPRPHNRCESVKRVCFQKLTCEVAQNTGESQWPSDSGHSNWRRNGTRQCVDNSALGETCSLSHVRGNGGFLRHPDDGVAGAASNRRPRGDQSNAQTGAKGETVEHRQPAWDTVCEGGGHFPRGKTTRPWKLEPAGCSHPDRSQQRVGNAKMYYEN